MLTVAALCESIAPGESMTFCDLALVGFFLRSELLGFWRYCVANSLRPSLSASPVAMSAGVSLSNSMAAENDSDAFWWVAHLLIGHTALEVVLGVGRVEADRVVEVATAFL